MGENVQSHNAKQSWDMQNENKMGQDSPIL